MKIAITGPECSGKTSLANWLQHKINAKVVTEYSREWFQKNIKNSYNLSNIIEIGLGQANLENELTIESKGKNIVCDTEQLVNIIWAEWKFNKRPDLLYKIWRPENYDLYILCKNDLPWEADPLRENEHRREELFNLYKTKLMENKIEFYELSGSGEERFKKVYDLLKNLI